MAKSTKTSPTAELLAALGSISTFSIPTSQGEVTFRQLTTSHLKQIIQTVIDAPIAGSLFSTAINKILAECLVTECVDPLAFNANDKLMFILATRIHSLSPLCRIDVGGVKKEVSLQGALDSVSALAAEGTWSVPSVTTLDGGICVTCSIPSIKTETSVDASIVRSVTDFDINDAQNLRDMIGRAFISELTKYINSVTVNEVEFDLSVYGGADRAKVVENLPASVTSVAVKFAENYKNAVEKCLTVKLFDGTEHVLKIDGSLFA